MASRDAAQRVFMVPVIGRRVSVALAAMIGLAGCSASQPLTFPGDTAEAQAAPVAVVRKDLTSVVALDAVTVSAPEYPVVAPRRGPVRFTSSADPGDSVKASVALATVGGQQVRAPYPGFVAQRLVPSGVTVAAGVAIIGLRLQGFGLTATVPPEYAYRVLTAGQRARGQIKNGPGPFDCPLVPLTGQGPGTRVLCVIPEDVRVFDGLPGLLGLTTDARQDVLTLPVGSVTALGGEGEVWKVHNGEPVRTVVEVGITNGIDVEIVSGLREGDLVLPFSPALRRPDS